jgi:hypothetical protein
MHSTHLTETSARLSQLEQSRNRWRTAAIGIAALAAGLALGGMGQAASRAKLAAIVLDPSRSSGRWSSTLISVDETGKVFFLDTSKPQSAWQPFQFSP